MKKPKPAVVSPGYVRRFEDGASGMGGDEFLVERGYTVKNMHGGGGAMTVTFPDGKRRNRVRRAELIEILDAERKKAGLEPIVRRK